MKDKKKLILILINVICVFIGSILTFLVVDNKNVQNLWILLVSSVLILTVLLNYPHIIRPISYFILSFFVFVWMRPFLSVFIDKPIITTGINITSYGIQKTTLFLGIAMCLMVALALLTEYYMNNTKGYIFSTNKQIYVTKTIIMIIVIISSLFFVYFIYDSINKIEIIKTQNYFTVAEGVLQTGYIFFRLGKYGLIIYILFGKAPNRMLWASTILLVASIGYLILGLRGYAISYFFLWLIFFQERHKIKMRYLVIGGICLIFLANKILEYRLGYTLNSGISNIIINTLHSQGASIEPVFGSVNFRNELLKVFPINELLTREDFGNYIDTVRGVRFEQGGFSTSFFAEVFFLGIPGLVFVTLMGICVGVLEHGYEVISLSNKYVNYYNILLFMTCPNLVYFARADIKDYIFKSISTCVIIILLIYIAQCQINGRREFCNGR